MNLEITSFSHYPNLRTLMIRKRYDTHIAIPEDIGNLTNLRKISILGCVPNFPLERLTQLEFLEIIGDTNHIHESFFKRKINKLPNLEFLANFSLILFLKAIYSQLNKLKICGAPFIYDYRNITNLSEIEINLSFK